MPLAANIALGFVVGISVLWGFISISERPMFGADPRVFTTRQGGTGTSSPSGILYGDESSSLKTVRIGSNLAFSGGVLSASASGGSGGSVGTSTTPVIGQLSFWSTSGATPELLGSVATSSLTATAPLSLSSPVAKVGGSNSVLSLDTSGTWSGTAGTASALTPGRNINNVLFDGTQNITITAASSTLLGDTNTWSGLQAFGSSGTTTFAGGIQTTALNITSSSASSTFANGINLAAGCFAVNGTCVGGGGGGGGTVTQIDTTYPILGGPITTTGTLSLAFGTTTSNTWGGTQTFTNTIAGSITGNAGTATALQTARTINGVSFDGTANITITAASSTLLGDTNTWSGLQAFQQGFISNASSSATNLSIIRSTTTHATTTNLAVSGLLTFNGITASTWAAFCTAITGGSGLCDGIDAPDIWPFTPETYYGQSVQSTSTALRLTGTPFSLFASSTTLFQQASSTLLTVSNTAWINTLNLTNALAVGSGGTGATSLTGLLVGNGTSAFTAITGTTCTNQFLRSFTSSGGTCATVGASDVSLANLSATDSTLTFSGTYNGSTARTIGVNLGASFTWTGTHDFSGAGLRLPVATAPTLGSSGRIALDSTSNNLIMASSSAGHFVVGSATTTLYSFKVASTSPDFASGRSFKLPAHPLAQVVTAIICQIEGGTSQVINLSNEGGTTDTNTITCDTTSKQFAITSNQSYAAYAVPLLEFGTKTGSPDYINIRILGYRTSD